MNILWSSVEFTQAKIDEDVGLVDGEYVTLHVYLCPRMGLSRNVHDLVDILPRCKQL